MSEFELLTPRPQNKFPHEDLTEDNYSLLDIMLDVTDADSLHRQIEQMSYLYVVGHATTERGSQFLNQEYYDRIREAMSKGILLYESVATLVRTDIDSAHNDSLLVNEKSINLLNSLNRGGDSVAIETRELFEETMPRTCNLIAEHVIRRAGIGYPVDYAKTGAAIAWRLEKDTTEPTSSV